MFQDSYLLTNTLKRHIYKSGKDFALDIKLFKKKKEELNPLSKGFNPI